MKKISYLLIIFLFYAECFAQAKSDFTQINDFDRYVYEKILEREPKKFDFFEAENDAIEYAKFLFTLDKYSIKNKDYEYVAYDAGDDWMIYIVEDLPDDEADELFDGRNEYIIIFKKGTGEVLRFVRYAG